jgi:glycosyltransferase involved in cell wall biosynthesis
VVVAENSYLEKYSKKFNNDVVVISAPIDTDKYVASGRREDGKVVVGWLGTPMTSYLLEMLEKPLVELAKRVPNLEIHNIAGKPIIFSGVKVKNIPWDEEREVEYLSALDIGVMPLDDIEFNKGRLGYKVILYSSMSIPSVADDVGLNKEIVRNGESGYLVKGEREWTDKLLHLIENPDLRTKMGAEARKFVVSTFDLRVCAEKYANIFQRLYAAKGNALTFHD